MNRALHPLAFRAALFLKPIAGLLLAAALCASCDSESEGVVVRGTVLNEATHDPIAGAVVTVLYELTEEVLGTATTGSSGRFEIELGGLGLLSSYLVHFEAARYESADIPLSAFVGEDREVLLTRFKATATAIGLQFVPIPAGTFDMGSTEGAADEQPVHTVTISKDFYLGKYEVTQKQWDAVMESNPSTFILCGSDCPVESVSWEDVQEFLSRLNEAEGQPIFRLPSEAEWEYAARSGASSRYFFGDDAGQLGEYAWFSGNAESQVHRVGRKQPNLWGLHDMNGNVWEWVADWYEAAYYEVSPSTDPPGPATGVMRVRRGGGWSNGPDELRSAGRSSLFPGSRHSVLGFRVLKTAD